MCKGKANTMSYSQFFIWNKQLSFFPFVLCVAKRLLELVIRLHFCDNLCIDLFA